MFDIASQGEELLVLVKEACYRMQPPLSASQTTVSLSLSKAPMSSFPLPSSNYMPTQAFLSLP
jgi:hypothetical protein